MKPRRRKAMKFLYFSLGLYGVGFASLAMLQRTFIYHPARGEERDFLAKAKAANVQEWRDENGQLIGWKRPNASAKYRLLVFHGNGGHALSRTYFFDGFSALGGEWEIYALEYPGYGWRAGNPTEKALVDDAARHARVLSESDGLSEGNARPLFLLGESLGTGVACQVAARLPQNIAGVVLVTPYSSVADVAAGRFPMYPTRLAIRDNFDSVAALKHYNGPVAVLLAGRDVIVPAHYGRKLFDSYGGPKKLWIQPQAGHNSMNYEPRAQWWKEVADFLTKAPR